MLIPSYYSFLVQPDEYRIQTTADGYLPYESSMIRVVDSDVTLDVPMARTQGILTTVGAAAPSKSLVYLPLTYH